MPGTRCGSLVAPNAIASWLMWSAIGLGLGDNNSNLANIQLWRCIVWLPFWFGALNMTWATIVAPLLQKDSSPSNSSIASVAFPLSSSSFDLAHHPTFITITFLLTHIISASVVFTLSEFTSINFNRGLSVTVEITAVLTSALNTPSAPPSVALDQAQLDDLLERFENIRKAFIFWSSWVWITWSVLGGLLFSALALAALINFRDLKEKMSFINEHATRSPSSRPLNSSAVKALSWAFWSLVATTGFLLVLMIGYMALGNVAKPADARSLLTPLYLAAPSGLLSNGLILYRTFAQQPQLSRTGSHRPPSRSSQQSRSLHRITISNLSYQVSDLTSDKSYSGARRPGGSQLGRWLETIERPEPAWTKIRSSEVTRV
ncbi:hypothetical protein T439DRAFT_366718 [Meredithblackwellia eburnea MCA 4105]